MEELQAVGAAINIAQGISDFGLLIILAASFIMLSLLMWIAIFRWFKSIIDTMIRDNSSLMNSLLQQAEEQKEMLADITENLRPTSLLQVKNISGTCFDLSVERVYQTIQKIREENNIKNHEHTKEKIRTLLLNLHENRNSRLDSFRFRGRPLSEYTTKEWIEWVAAVIEKEIYSDTPSERRARTNITTVYDKIKIDFYHRLTQENKTPL